MLKVGAIYRTDGRLWRCGLVNVSRARLDPISSYSVSSVNTGRGFKSYGTSINVGCNALMDEVPIEDLSEDDLIRYARLTEREEEMAKGQVAAAPIPETTKGERLKRLNEERKEQLAAGKVAGQLAGSKAASAKVAGAPVAPRASSKGPAVKDKQCKCGCGQATSGYFFPGHDARFKGWLLQIERGKAKPEDLLTPEVRAAYTWKRKGDGLIPTTNYKGEPHDGYDK